MTEIVTKKCSICKQGKPEPEFRTCHECRTKQRTYREKHKTRINALRVERESRNREKVNKWKREHRLKNPDRYRDEDLRHNYGITLEQLREMEARQNNKCAICGMDASESRYGCLQVDHDHETGAIRGLLCRTCNVGLGCFKDSQETLTRAVTYLKGATQ